MSAALCFPTMRYILLALFFIASFVLLFSKTLEVVGISMFFIVNLLFTISIGLDMMQYVSANIYKISIADKASIMTIASCFVMNLASSVFLLITVQSLRSKFKKAGENTLQLSNYNRDRLTRIKQLFVWLTLFLSAISINIYFDSIKNLKWISEIMAKYIFPSNSWVYICTLIAIFINSTILMDYFITQKNDNISSTYQLFIDKYNILFSFFMLILAYFPIKYVLTTYTSVSNNLFTYVVLLFTIVLSIAVIIAEFIEYYNSNYTGYEEIKHLEANPDKDINMDQMNRIVRIENTWYKITKRISIVMLSIFLLVLVFLFSISLLPQRFSIQSIPILNEFIYLVQNPDFYGFITKCMIIIVFVILTIKLYTIFYTLSVNHDTSVNKTAPGIISLFRFATIFFIMNTLNAKTFTLLVVALMKYILPIIVFALSIYLIYSTNTLALLYRHEIAQ